MSSQLTPEQVARVRELVQAVYHEQANPDETAELCRWIETSREAAWIYAQYMHLFAGLHWDKMHESKTTPSKVSLTAAGKASPVLGLLGDCWNQGISFLSKSSVFSLLVAIGLPGAIFLFVVLSLVHQTPPGPVALIARSRDSAGRLDDRPTTFYPGSNLFSQQTLVIDEGLVEIQFADGASAVLEGPAVFDVLGRNAGLLTKGRLAATVPPEGRGFAVETPSATVVDLGTEFGVLVDDEGQVEAHVFGGQVEVAFPAESVDSPRQTTLLTEGEAVHIAATEKQGKSPKIVRMPAAAERFTRTIPLPEPTILFAHHGSADPTTEGWRLHYRQYGAGFPKNGKNLGKTCPEVGPIDDGGTAAWQIQPLADGKRVTYELRQEQGLTPELRAEAREKGWVLRARIRIDDAASQSRAGQPVRCVVTYRDEKRTWNIAHRLDADGNQYVKGAKPGFGPFADSRNQYLDFELRHNPVTGSAKLYVNGRHVATFKGSGDRDLDSDDGNDAPYPVLRFGSLHQPANVRLAKVEWGILRDADGVKPQP
jgi:hypothetical protein